MDAIRFAYSSPNLTTSSSTIDLLGYHDSDVITQEIRAHRSFFELDLLEHVLLAGPRGGLYLDVGANIGNHAVYFGKYCADHVIAVEPHPLLVPILKRNLEQNCPGKFTISPGALSDTIARGRMTLRRGFEKNIGASQIEAVTDEVTAGYEHTVPITTLDTLMRDLGVVQKQQVTLMKVDVEGMELQVFQGARQLLEQHRPQIVVELATEEARQSTRAYLATFGYRDSGQRFGWTPTYHFIDPSVHELRTHAVARSVDHEVEMLKRITDDLLRVVPAGQSYILVDQEQIWPGLAVDGRKRWPFTERNGVYWGPPADDAAALSELRRLRAEGARFIAFAAPAFWFLTFYKKLEEHLREHDRLVLKDELLVVYEFTEADGKARNN